MSELGTFIVSFMNSRRLAVSDLTERLHYRSKTTINRLLRDESRENSIRTFEKNLRETFVLTADESHELDRAVQLAIYGREHYEISARMWSFLGCKTPGTEPPRPIELRLATDRSTEDMRSRYEGRRDLRFTVINCQSMRDLFDILRALCHNSDAKVEHYIYITNDNVRTVACFDAMERVFHEPNYMSYARSGAGDEQEPVTGIRSADLIYAEYTLEDGHRACDQLLFTGPNSATLFAYGAAMPFDPALIGIDRDHFVPVKLSDFDSGCEDYLTYSENYARMEHNRSIWQIKPDIGIEKVPADITIKAADEGEFAAFPEYPQLREAFLDLYRRRFDNIWSKKKHCHTILKFSAMLNFARTGMSTDHFWGCRAYTPDERREILENLLRQQTGNRYAHYYFVRDENLLENVELSYFDGIGLLITRSETDYDLAHGHSEALISQPEFLRIFRDFYMNTLLKNYVFPESTTRAMIEELIRSVPEE